MPSSIKNSSKKLQEEKDEELNNSLDEEMTSPEVVKTPVSFSKKKFILGLVIGVVTVVVLLLVVFSYLFYRSSASYPVVNKVAHFLNLPIASVEGKFVNYKNFDLDYQTLKYSYTKQIELNGDDQTAMPSDLTIKNDVLNQLINKELINHLAAKYKLVVSDIEVEGSWQKEVVSNFSTEQEAIDKIKEYYNMIANEFKERVLRANLLATKVAEAIDVDKDMQAPVEKKAQEVLDQVKKSEKSFEDLAKEYSDDQNAKTTGGDLGWLTHEDMTTVPEIDTVAFSLEKDKTSELIKTSYGYYLIKVEDKKAASTDGKEKEQVKLRGIFIKKVSLLSYLADIIKTNKVKKYINFEVAE
jgi:parvulin-like peptidyl-prolyl isomerase